MSASNKTFTGLTLTTIILAGLAFPTFAETARQSPAGFRYDETTAKHERNAKISNWRL